MSFGGRQRNGSARTRARFVLVGVSLLASFLCVSLSVPVANATHDPNDFFTTEATFPGLGFAGKIMGDLSANVWATKSATPNAIAHRNGVWVNEVTARNQNIDVWVASSTSAYTVVQSASVGTPVDHWDGLSWSPMGTSTITNGRAIWGFTDSDIWIAGSQGGAGANWVVEHWDGVSWIVCGTCNFGLVTDNVFFANGLFGIAPSDLWAYANFGLWHYTGTWAQVATVPDTITGIWGATTNDVWAVGEIGGNLGAIYHWDGSSWTLAFQAVGPVYDVWGNSASDIWAVGAAGLILHYDGLSWTTEATTTNAVLRGVWCRSVSLCWLHGELGGSQIIQKLQFNAPIAYPSLAGFTYDPDNLHISASQAQCLGDGVSLAVDIEPSVAAGGTNLVGYVSRTSDGIVVETLPQAGWTINAGNKHFAQDRTYPSGDYELLVTVDHTPIVQDNFASWAFNVPVGTCLDSNQDGHDDHMSEEHFDQDLLHPGGGGSGGLIPLSNFPGIPLDDSTGIFLLFVLMLWALTESLFFLGAASLMGIMATWLGSLDPGGEWDGGTGFAVALGLVILAVWVEAIVRAARNSVKPPEAAS